MGNPNATSQQPKPGTIVVLPDGTELVAVADGIAESGRILDCSECYLRNQSCTAFACVGVIYMARLDYCMRRASAAL